MASTNRNVDSIALMGRSHRHSSLVTSSPPPPLQKCNVWVLFLLAGMAAGSVVFGQLMLKTSPASIGTASYSSRPNESFAPFQLSFQPFDERSLDRSCSITSFSTDGTGHQMEGKLSCLATALALNWTYVHKAVDSVEHNEVSSQMEHLFRLSSAVDRLPQYLALRYDPDGMILTARDLFFHDGLFYTGGRCYSQPTIQQKFQELCDNVHLSSSTKRTVLYNDNCWDFFWCQNQPLPESWWTSVVPLMRQSMLLGETASITLQGSKRKDSKLVSVAMHVRLGDAGIRRMDPAWGTQVLHNLYAGAADSGNKLQVSIHSDGERLEVIQMLNLNISHIEAGSIVLYCKGEEHATVGRAVSDMMSANILVLSESSLTHTAAFLRYPHDGLVIHPTSDIRNRMSAILGWHMLRKSNDNTGNLERCVEALPDDEMDCQVWSTTDLEYWSALVKTA